MYAFKAVVLIIDYCSVKVKYSRQNSCGCRVSSIEEILRIFFFFFPKFTKVNLRQNMFGIMLTGLSWVASGIYRRVKSDETPNSVTARENQEAI